MYSDADTLSGGLPHSEIPGSTIARISPGLFAACHVLHRLSVPRHPPDALTLRLSATPNGKDHPISPRKHRGHEIADAQPFPGYRGQTLSSRRHFVAGPTRRPQNTPYRTCHGPHTVSRYGHTYSLLYDYQSASCPGPNTAAPRQFLRLRRVTATVGPIAGELAAKASLSPEVEVIGIEPTTPCLQSRCSPS